jgi:hypothetical protein
MIRFGRRKNPPMRTDGLWANRAGSEGDDMRMNEMAQRSDGGMFSGCLTGPWAGYTRGCGITSVTGGVWAPMGHELRKADLRKDTWQRLVFRPLSPRAVTQPYRARRGPPRSLHDVFRAGKMSFDLCRHDPPGGIQALAREREPARRFEPAHENVAERARGREHAAGTPE